MSFYDWLRSQTERQDAVGAFARHAVKDKIFPRGAWRLHYFLLRYEHHPEHRKAYKSAHREWRRLRRTFTTPDFSATEGHP